MAHSLGLHLAGWTAQLTVTTVNQPLLIISNTYSPEKSRITNGDSSTSVIVVTVVNWADPDHNKLLIHQPPSEIDRHEVSWIMKDLETDVLCWRRLARRGFHSGSRCGHVTPQLMKMPKGKLLVVHLIIWEPGIANALVQRSPTVYIHMARCHRFHLLSKCWVRESREFVALKKRFHTCSRLNISVSSLCHLHVRHSCLCCRGISSASSNLCRSTGRIAQEATWRGETCCSLQLLHESFAARSMWCQVVGADLRCLNCTVAWQVMASAIRSPAPGSSSQSVNWVTMTWVLEATGGHLRVPLLQGVLVLVLVRFVRFVCWNSMAYNSTRSEMLLWWLGYRPSWWMVVITDHNVTVVNACSECLRMMNNSGLQNS